MLSDEEDEFVAFHIPRKSLSKEFQGKYRIYFRDGSSEDFEAETVTEALSALSEEKNSNVMKIVNLEMEYKKTLKNNFISPTEESVPTQIEPDKNVPKNLGFYFFGDLAEEDQTTEKEPFEAVSLVDVASITAGEEIQLNTAADNAVEATEESPQVAHEEIIAPEEVEPVAPEPAEPARQLSPQEVRDLLKDEDKE